MAQVGKEEVVFPGEGSVDEVAAGTRVDEEGAGGSVDTHLDGEQPLRIVTSGGGVKG